MARKISRHYVAQSHEKIARWLAKEKLNCYIFNYEEDTIKTRASIAEGLVRDKGVPVSAIITILASCAISGGGALGELAAPVLQEWALPERVSTVYATTHDLLFHWSEHPGGPGDLRADTATYQWMSRAILATIAHPYAFILEAKREICQLIGRVEPPSAQYRTTQYIRLVLEYKPRGHNPPSDPVIQFKTWIPHSQRKIRAYLKKAVLLSTLPQRCASYEPFPGAP